MFHLWIWNKNICTLCKESFHTPWGWCSLPTVAAVSYSPWPLAYCSEWSEPLFRNSWFIFLIFFPGVGRWDTLGNRNVRQYPSHSMSLLLHFLSLVSYFHSFNPSLKSFFVCLFFASGNRNNSVNYPLPLPNYVLSSAALEWKQNEKRSKKMCLVQSIWSNLPSSWKYIFQEKKCVIPGRKIKSITLRFCFNYTNEIRPSY